MACSMSPSQLDIRHMVCAYENHPRKETQEWSPHSVFQTSDLDISLWFFLAPLVPLQLHSSYLLGSAGNFLISHGSHRAQESRRARAEGENKEISEPGNRKALLDTLSILGVGTGSFYFSNNNNKDMIMCLVPFEVLYSIESLHENLRR